MAASKLNTIGQALDAISWEWLETNYPLLAEAIQRAVDGNTDPAEVKRYVMQHTQRYELALRCEQAARWLIREEG